MNCDQLLRKICCCASDGVDVGKNVSPSKTTEHSTSTRGLVIRVPGEEDTPSWLDAYVNQMQIQMNELRDAHFALKRDVEAMRRHNSTLEQKVTANHKELTQKLDTIILHGELPLIGRNSRYSSGSKEQDEHESIMMATGLEMSGPFARAAKIFCGGPILDAVQHSRIFPDSKTFVDMPLKEDPEVVLAAFDKLSPEEREDFDVLKKFLDTWFLEAGSDFEDWVPPDMVPHPPQLMTIQNPDMRNWALEINKLWLVLGRKLKDDFIQAPQRTTMLPRTSGMIVPGGRFREMYYWDTYWVVKGLLICNMVSTAKGLVDNFLERVGSVGFIPNGSRIYYLDRSQPPMLTPMVSEIYSVTGDKKWLAEALPMLEKEYRFWMDPKGGHLVELPRLSGEKQVLNIFRSIRRTPRPESYREDMESCRAAVGKGRNAQDVYEAICSAAESGWDFSTRWLDDSAGRAPLGSADMTTADTCHVIPACLNSILYRVEETISKFHQIISGECDASIEFKGFAATRARTMNAWLWNGDAYHDYRLDVGAPSAVISISDWAVPLWAGLQGPDNKCGPAMVLSLKRSGILRVCGCATTAVDSSGRTQWDAPNAWPPMMHMLIDGLDKVDGAEALSDTLSEAWLRANYITYQRTGYMHEKYDVFEPGREGAGGEYEPQVGFGWSNGVALTLLVRAPRVSLEGNILPRVNQDVRPGMVRHSPSFNRLRAGLPRNSSSLTSMNDLSSSLNDFGPMQRLISPHDF